MTSDHVCAARKLDSWLCVLLDQCWSCSNPIKWNALKAFVSYKYYWIAWYRKLCKNVSVLWIHKITWKEKLVLNWNSRYQLSTECSSSATDIPSLQWLRGFSLRSYSCHTLCTIATSVLPPLWGVVLRLLNKETSLTSVLQTKLSYSEAIQTVITNGWNDVKAYRIVYVLQNLQNIFSLFISCLGPTITNRPDLYCYRWLRLNSFTDRWSK